MKNLLFVPLIVFLILLFQGCARQEVIIPIPQEIEEAIKVKGAVNVIEVTKGVGLGGGVGVGMGAAEIRCKTPEQFLELIPPNEKIFTSVEKIDHYTVVRRYLVFMKNKPGVFIYETIVNYPYERKTAHNTYKEFGIVKNYNEKEVTFIIY